MKVLVTGNIPNGTNIQIEDWSENYHFHNYADTIASYPISKMTHAGAYAPKAGETYRFAFKFESTEEAKNAYDDLITGRKELSDFRSKMDGKLEYRNCI